MRNRQKWQNMTKKPRLKWSLFERDRLGQLYVEGHGLVKMRIGLFMGIPMQVLIARGKTIKSKKISDSKRTYFMGNYKLKWLNIKNPDECLYEVFICNQIALAWSPWYVSSSDRRSSSD